MISILLIAAFIVVMIGIGIWGMRRTTTLNDFFLGGRSIGPWVSAFAYGTTYFSAVIFIGFAGKLGWGFGFNALWIAAGNALIGSLCAWLVLGSRTRIMTQNLNVMTMPEFLQERYSGKFLKLISAAVIFVFLVPYSASVFKGLGYLFEANFHIPYETALLVMVLITGIYLVLGGYFAITLTDLVQGVVMLFGAVIMVAVLVGKAGGLEVAISGAAAAYQAHIPVAKRPDLLLLIGLVIMTSLGTWGMPQMVQKFYAIKDERVIVRAAVITTLFAIVITFSAYFTGALTHVFFSAPPIVNGKPAFDIMIPDMLTRLMPEGLMALILLLVLSASMSTLSSLVLVSASTVAVDMYKGHINPAVTKERSLVMMRFLSGLFVLASYVIARYDFSIIITLMSLSWGVVAGTFLAPYLWGLYWKRATRAGAAAAMAAGFTLAITLFYALGPARAPIASSIAMLVPLAILPLVSLCTRAPDDALIERSFAGIK